MSTAPPTDGARHRAETAHELPTDGQEPLPPLEGYSADAADVVGKVLDGRYLIESVLGRGAMAVVLGARHVFLGKKVAVKVLHPSLVSVDEMKGRFLREARATSHVGHESVVTVTDFGVSPEGLHYLVMEQLEGENLLTWSEARGMASALEAAAIGAQVCEALGAIHAAGYVHRDLKPENVWVLASSESGKPPKIKVLDLGIAALIEDDDDERLGRSARSRGEHRLTRAGQTLGTVLYMSPEQALGDGLDGRSDLYALGCILWELVTDACCFEGASQVDIMMKQTAMTPLPPSSKNPDVPEWFDAIVLRCLEKRPDDRYQTAADLRAALLAHLPSDGIVGPMIAPVPRRTAPKLHTETGPAPTAEHAAFRSTPQKWWVPGAVVVLLITALVLLLTTSDAPPPQAAGVEPPPTPTTAPTTTAPTTTATAPTTTAPTTTAPTTTAPATTAPTTTAPTTTPTTMTTPTVVTAPARATLTFDVDPAGTTVKRDGTTLGLTPLTLEVDRAATVAHYELSHAGRTTLVVDVTPDRDQTIQRALARTVRTTGAGTPHEVGSDVPPLAATGGADAGTHSADAGSSGTTTTTTTPDAGTGTQAHPGGSELWQPESPQNPKKAPGSSQR